MLVTVHYSTNVSYSNEQQRYIKRQCMTTQQIYDISQWRYKNEQPPYYIDIVEIFKEIEFKIVKNTQ